MITLSNIEIDELLCLSGHAVRLYLYLVRRYQNINTVYKIENICTELKFSKRTMYRCIKELKSYITYTTKGSTLDIRFHAPCAKSVTPSAKSVTKLNHNEYALEETHNEYDLSDEFYEKLENMGVRIDDELKKLCKFVGNEEVYGIYQRVMWDTAIKKPSTIFLRELQRASKTRKIEIRERVPKKVFNVLGKRIETLQWIFTMYGHEGKNIESFKKAAKYHGYTKEEIKEFLGESQN